MKIIPDFLILVCIILIVTLKNSMKSDSVVRSPFNNFVKKYMKKKQLTEEEKIFIITKREMNQTFSSIAASLNRPPSTIKSFMKSYTENKTLFPKRGRKPIVRDSENLRTLVVSGVNENPFMTIRSQASLLSVSNESVRNIRNQEKIKYYKVKEMPPITQEKKESRIKYCHYILSFPSMPPVIFTDESTVQVNLVKRGIWRKRGLFPEGSLVQSKQYPISVMVWGGIGPNGYRTELLRCPPKVTSITYAQMLSDNNVLDQTEEKVPGFIWQQDNAPPHNPCFRVIENRLGNNRIVKWPASSPDLSPIENIWAIIKDKLKGLEFQSADELFSAIRYEWWNISSEIIINLHQSAYYRCILCLNHQGECLNSHWSEVHKLHHPAE